MFANNVPWKSIKQLRVSVDCPLGGLKIPDLERLELEGTATGELPSIARIGSLIWNIDAPPPVPIGIGTVPEIGRLILGDRFPQARPFRVLEDRIDGRPSYEEVSDLLRKGRFTLDERTGVYLNSLDLSGVTDFTWDHDGTPEELADMHLRMSSAESLTFGRVSDLVLRSLDFSGIKSLSFIRYAAGTIPKLRGLRLSSVWVHGTEVVLRPTGRMYLDQGKLMLMHNMDLGVLDVLLVPGRLGRKFLEANPDLGSARHLRFCEGFDQPMDDLDLKRVTNLTMGDSFNQPIDALDLKMVTHLNLGNSFNRHIHRLDLQMVTHLNLGDAFDKAVVGHSTSSSSPTSQWWDLKNVKYLNFGAALNQPIHRLDLKGVVHLRFGHRFTQPVDQLETGRLEWIVFDGNHPQRDSFEKWVWYRISRDTYLPVALPPFSRDYNASPDKNCVCGICGADLAASTPSSLTCCGHAFHKLCLEEFLVQDDRVRCPECPYVHSQEYRNRVFH